MTAAPRAGDLMTADPTTVGPGHPTDTAPPTAAPIGEATGPIVLDRRTSPDRALPVR